MKQFVLNFIRGFWFGPPILPKVFQRGIVRVHNLIVSPEQFREKVKRRTKKGIEKDAVVSENELYESGLFSHG